MNKVTRVFLRDSYNPKTVLPPELEKRTYAPKAPGATTQPKTPLAPAETGTAEPTPPPSKDS
jgi:hypothetical protein